MESLSSITAYQVVLGIACLFYFFSMLMIVLAFVGDKRIQFYIKNKDHRFALTGCLTWLAIALLSAATMMYLRSTNLENPLHIGYCITFASLGFITLIGAIASFHIKKRKLLATQ